MQYANSKNDRPLFTAGLEWDVGGLMDAGIVLQQVAILFMVLAIGLAARKGGKITDRGISDISTLVVEVTAPALVLTSFQFEFSPDLARIMGIIALGALIIHLLALLAGKVLFRGAGLTVDKKTVLWFASVFSNAAFIGYPILQSVLGETGVLLGAMYVLMFNLFAYSVGTGMFTGQAKAKDMLKSLLNPGILCTVLGLALFLLRIRLPLLLREPLAIVGSATTPLSMLVVGARLGDIRLRDGFGGGWRFYLSIALRNLIYPLLVVAACRAFHAPASATAVLALETAMPVATMTALFAEKFGGDKATASRLVFVSTLFSLFTVPLVTFLAA